MENIKNILLFIVLVGSMQSCVDTIPVPVEPVDAKLVFRSDMSTNDFFRAYISTSTSITDVQGITRPENVDVRITTNTDETIELVYTEDCTCYLSVRKPRAGVPYTLKANMVDNDIYEDITAKMTIPGASSIAEFDGELVKENNQSSVIARLDIQEANNTSRFFHVLPYRKITKKYVDTNGEEQLEYTGEIEYLALTDFSNPEVYVEDMFHKDGFLIDFSESKPSESSLNLLLSSNFEIDYDNHEFHKVFFELRSVTESYYRWEVYQSRQLSSLQDGIVEPAISYGNITRGKGYFGGYSSKVDSFNLK